MKGYEWLNLVYVILLFLFGPYLVSGQPERHRQHQHLQRQHFSFSGGMTSTCTREPSTIWLRNACHGGFLTMTKGRKKTRVLSQHKGLRSKSPKVELIKESCHDESAGFLGSVTMRLFSPYAQKYVCFNHRGKVLAKSSKSVGRLGPLCMFLERTLSMGSRSYVQFQSSYNPEWYLGFDGSRVIEKRRRSTLFSHTLPRRMRKSSRHHHHHRKRKLKCDFSFSSGSFHSIQEDFSGLIEHVRKQKKESDQLIEEETLSFAKTEVINDILVQEISKSPAYYYIESNDERYKPEDVLRGSYNEENRKDPEDLVESKLSFLNFKSNMKTTSPKSSSSKLSSSSKPLKRRRKKKLNSRRRKLSKTM